MQMKKLVAIICILLVIFIGMYINKSKSTQNRVTASEVSKIEEYISKIYIKVILVIVTSIITISIYQVILRKIKHGF